MGWRDQSTPAGAAADTGGAGPEPLLDYGAPNFVRLAVGMARPRDRLATLRMYYPDAQPFGNGNFMFTDPGTKRPRLYNPGGLDRGDFPAITREAAEVLGQAGGAVLGAPLGLGGSLAGSALGGAAADQVVDLARRAFGQPTTATPAQMATDAATDLIAGTGGEAAGMALQALPGAIRQAIVRPGARAVAQAGENLGIRPTVGMLAQGPVASSEHLAANVLPASRAAREQGRFGQQIRAFAENVIPGAAMTPREAAREGGAALREGAQQGYDRFRATRQRLDNSVYAAFPANATVPTGNVQRVATDLQARIAQAPNTFGPALQPVLDRVNGFLADAGQAGALPVQVHRNARTLVGQELESPATTQLTGEAQRSYRDFYRAMTDDLRTAARTSSPRALRLLDRHDRLVRAFRGEDMGRESVADSLDSIIRSASDEKAYSALVNGGVGRMNNVLNRLDPAQQRMVARATWDRMLTTPQGNMNLNYLLGQWNKADPAARRSLFGRVADMGNLDDLMTLLGGMRDADRSRNFSNTAYTLIQASLGDRAVSEVATKLGALVTGGAAAGAMFPTETIGALASGYLMSEALHSPAMARALAETARNGRPELTESVRRSVARALAQATGRDLMAEDQPAPVPRESTSSVNANATRNSNPRPGWRDMSTTP